MKTDISLKRLMSFYGNDLLPLLGMPYDTLLQVETKELPAGAKRLDNLLHVRSPGGQVYLHLLEWQGYYDRAVIWRVLDYLAWIGREYPGFAVVATIIYLRPEYDVGHTLPQVIDGQTVQEWKIGRVRLWEHDAHEALASGHLGLALLSPLMKGADRALAEHVVEMALRQTPQPQQQEIFSILATFTETLIGKDRLIAMIGKEKLMQSSVINSLVEEAVNEQIEERFAQRLNEELAKRLNEELAKEWAKWEQQQKERQERERQERERQERERQEILQTLVDAVATRFPQASISLVRDIWQIPKSVNMHDLFLTVVKAQNEEDFARLLKEYLVAARAEKAAQEKANS